MRITHASWPLLLCLALLSGCARHYVLKLNNGSEITTATKPRLKGGNYYYKDARGEEHILAAGRVREMAPASVAKKENKPQPVKGPPKKRKWYFLWLA